MMYLMVTNPYFIILIFAVMIGWDMIQSKIQSIREKHSKTEEEYYEAR